jgi:hypothetical protein
MERGMPIGIDSQDIHTSINALQNVVLFPFIQGSMKRRSPTYEQIHDLTPMAMFKLEQPPSQKLVVLFASLDRVLWSRRTSTHFEEYFYRDLIAATNSILQ